MRVALAVPCYIDQLRPQAARAALTLLERLGCEVSLAFDAPCCGQPLANIGASDAAREIADRWIAASGPFDAIVLPSGSCTHHVRHHLPSLLPGSESSHAAAVTWELSEFIAGPLGVARLAGAFPHRVAMHLGCHAQRGLRLGHSSELHERPSGAMHRLLSSLDGITLVPIDRDECCGFGGSFSVGEPEVSASMGRDRIRDVVSHGAEVLVSSDASCLLHLDGIVRNANDHRSPVIDHRLRTMHIAELLEEATR